MEPIRHLEQINIFTSSDFRDLFNQLVDRVNSLNAGGAGGGVSASASPATRARYGIPVKITGYGTNPGYYTFSEVIQQGSTTNWETRSGGVTDSELGEARGLGEWLNDLNWYPIIGRVVLIRPGLMVNSDGLREFCFNIPTPITFPVKMEQTGGASGNQTTQCSYTYTITDIDDHELATEFPPESDRPEVGTLIPATWGIGYWISDPLGNPDVPQLVVKCVEPVDVEAC